MNTQSLTVRILGDSTHLQNQLSRVLEQIEQLQQRIAEVTPAAGEVANGLGRVSTAVRPLQQVERLLAGVTQQVRVLSRTPVTLNVSPALQALQRLKAAIEAVAAVLSALNVSGGGSAVPSGPGLAAPAASPRQFATGGLVTGPTGRDRVPALLSAGEFVLRTEAVRDLGLETLHRLNAGQTVRDDSASTRSAPFRSQGAETNVTTNHFGGITVNVRETADVSRLVRELRWQGIDLRHRRG